MRRTVLAILFSLSFAFPAPAEDWPGWRGPRGDGTSTDKGFPLEWSATKNVKWKTPIPGKGHSSPVVWGDSIFVTSCLEGERPPAPKDKKEKAPEDPTPRERMLYCVDRNTGAIKWGRVVLKAKLEGLHKLNSFASSTPAVDGKHVFVTFYDQPNVRVFCYDLDGNLKWEKTPGAFRSVHGFSSPPVLYKDTLIVNADHDGKGYVVCLAKADGAEKWRIARPNNTRSYCPPLIVEAAGKTQMVMTGSKCVASYDPETGKQIWTIDGPTEQFVASMVFHKGLFFLTSGFPTYHAMAIKPDGTGNVTKTHVAWHETKGAGYVPSPLAVNGFFFNVKDEGLATCRNADTGELLWDERLGRHHSASPVFAEDRLYFLDDYGIMWIVKAGPKFELLAKNDLKEECYASPAFVGGRIYIRGLKNLYCIGD